MVWPFTRKQTRVEQLRSKVRELEEQAEVARLESHLRLLETDQRVEHFRQRMIDESQLLAESYWGEPLTSQDYSADVIAGLPNTRSIDHPQDTKDGDYIPHFETEQELSEIRGRCRAAYQLDTLVQNVTDTVKNYVIGVDGIKHSVEPKHKPKPKRAKLEEPQEGEGAPPAVAPAEPRTLTESEAADQKLSEQCQEVIDELLERERWFGDLEDEMFCRECYDGERVVHVQHTGGGYSRLRVIEPSWITEPSNRSVVQADVEAATGSGELSYKYGVITDKHDTSLVYGLFTIPNGDTEAWEYLPIEEVAYHKRNTPRRVKRGLPDGYSAEAWRQLSGRVLHNTLISTGVESAIALVRTHGASTTQEQARALGQSEVTYVYDKEQGKRVAVTNYRPGSVIDVKGYSYDWGPTGTHRGNAYLEVAAAAARRYGMRYSAPDHIINADASKANYASTLAAESPFTKRAQSLQSHTIMAEVDMLWIALRNAIEGGRIKGVADLEELKERVTIKSEEPSIAYRDRKVDTDIRAAKNKAGILSKQTWSEEEGHDYEQEQSRIEDEAKQGVAHAQEMMKLQPQPIGPDGKPVPPQPGQEGGQQPPGEPSMPGDRISQGIAEEVIPDRVRGLLLAEGCGANAPGGGGFQKGNTCSLRDGAGGDDPPADGPKDPAAVQHDATVAKFADEEWVEKLGDIPDVEFGGATPEDYLAAQDGMARSAFLTPHTPESLREILDSGGQIFLSDDGATGYILTGEGDFGGLFANKAKGAAPGAGTAALVDGIVRGAKTLDCFEPFLPRLYNQFGFKAKDALAFADEYAPDGWEFEKYGRPDVVFMEYRGNERTREAILAAYGSHGDYTNPRGPKGWRGANEGAGQSLAEGLDAGAGGGSAGLREPDGTRLIEETATKSACGANAPGGGGFQKGNQCSKKGAGGLVEKASNIKKPKTDYGDTPYLGDTNDVLLPQEHIEKLKAYQATKSQIYDTKLLKKWEEQVKQKVDALTPGKKAGLTKQKQKLHAMMAEIDATYAKVFKEAATLSKEESEALVAEADAATKIVNAQLNFLAIEDVLHIKELPDHWALPLAKDQGYDFDAASHYLYTEKAIAKTGDKKPADPKKFTAEDAKLLNKLGVGDSKGGSDTTVSAEKLAKLKASNAKYEAEKHTKPYVKIDPASLTPEQSRERYGSNEKPAEIAKQWRKEANASFAPMADAEIPGTGKSLRTALEEINGVGQNELNGEKGWQSSAGTDFRKKIKSMAMEANGAKLASVLEQRLGADAASAKLDEAAKSFYSPFGKTSAEKIHASIADSWAGSSSNGNTSSVAAQLAVAQEFGFEPDLHSAEEKTITEAKAVVEKHGDVLRAWARALHERTQEWFKNAGIDHVVLHRGYGAPPSTLGPVLAKQIGAAIADSNDHPVVDAAVKLNPISSFANNPAVSYGFGSGSGENLEMLATTRVPVERILGNAVTGLGCYSEHEFVVMGGQPLRAKLRVRNKKNPSNWSGWAQQHYQYLGESHAR